MIAIKGLHLDSKKTRRPFSLRVLWGQNKCQLKHGNQHFVYDMNDAVRSFDVTFDHLRAVDVGAGVTAASDKRYFTIRSSYKLKSLEIGDFKRTSRNNVVFENS